MITVNQNNEVYEVSFSYDPFVVDLVKNVPGRRWVASAKMWTIPKDKLGFLLAQFKGTVYENAVKIISDEQINENATLDTTVKIPNIDISQVPYYVKEGAEPFRHQLDFMKYGIFRQLKGNMNGFVVGDDPGLAKTSESMNLAIYNQKQYNFQHCLVICCVNCSKYNWVEDIKLHTRGKYVPYILGSRWRRNKSGYRVAEGKEKYDDLMSLKQYGLKDGDPLPYFIVMNVEAIRYKIGKKYAIADRLIELINQKYISMIIIDEVHKNLSPSSIQGKQLMRIKKSITESLMWLPMSGTPITKRPTDLFMPLRLIDAHRYNSFYMWSKEYCIYGGYGGHEIVGYKNVPRLKSQLQNNMIRRLKADVLKDLPSKIHYTEYVDNTPYQERLYENLVSGLLNEQEVIVKSLNPLSKFLRLRQVNGNPELIDTSCDITSSDYLRKNAKLQRLLELLEEIHERHEKVVIFSNWVESLRTLYKFVSKKYKTCCFTGTMKESDRQKHKEVFINNPNYTVMIGTFGALGTTHTLTVARNVIMYDEPWNPSDKSQAEDRCYRIGTKSSVNIYTLITRNTVDDRVHDILYTKSGISEFIVDDKLDIVNNPQLFNLLLSDTLKNSRGEI